NLSQLPQYSDVKRIEVGNFYQNGSMMEEVTMKTLLLVIALLVILQTSSFARIGETFEQCTNRYGKGQNSSIKDGKVMFVKQMSKDNFMYIEIEFDKDGKAGRIVYSRGLRNNGDPDRAPFNKHEIYALLEANTGEGTIKKWRYGLGADDSDSTTVGEMWGYPGSVPGEFKGEWRVVAKITAKHFKNESIIGGVYDNLELETREHAMQRIKTEKENEAKNEATKGAAAVQKLKGF
ncbi:MAG: hypothetical protein L6437_07765, partial [Kiritimatiellae bacterium]|nr:hypothetical protein [Kiritimatiellia bacterium]